MTDIDLTLDHKGKIVVKDIDIMTTMECNLTRQRVKTTDKINVKTLHTLANRNPALPFSPLVEEQQFAY